MDHVAVAVIERVLASGVLVGNLVTVPGRGATLQELHRAEEQLGRPLSPHHRALLRRWNGIDLEVLRLYGVGAVETGIKDLVAEQRGWEDVRPGMVIGSDPAGFVYLALPTSEVLCYDTDGGESEIVARNVDDLLARHVFGDGAPDFGGADWAEQLRRAGVADL